MDWHFITGEYPPYPGGVSDYTRVVARELSRRRDEVVHVWTPETKGDMEAEEFEVHRLPGRFGRRARALMEADLAKLPRPRVILLQYVPHLYGCKAMNIPFCRWLRRLGRVETIWTMFHEVHYPISRAQSPLHNFLGSVTRYMARQVAAASSRLFVTTPLWGEMLRQIYPACVEPEWLPVPSNLPTEADKDEVEQIRGSRPPCIVGHFGTYGAATSKLLYDALILLLRRNTHAHVLLIGRGSESFRQKLFVALPTCHHRVHATGATGGQDVVNNIVSCDVMLQPYAGGACARRGSLMAVLAVGGAVVTTCGSATEPIWAASGAIKLSSSDSNSLSVVSDIEDLLGNPVHRRELSQKARRLYKEHFAVEHTVKMLLQGAPLVPGRPDKPFNRET